MSTAFVLLSPLVRIGTAIIARAAAQRQELPVTLGWHMRMSAPGDDRHCALGYAGRSQQPAPGLLLTRQAGPRRGRRLLAHPGMGGDQNGALAARQQPVTGTGTVSVDFRNSRKGALARRQADTGGPRPGASWSSRSPDDGSQTSRAAAERAPAPAARSWTGSSWLGMRASGSRWRWRWSTRLTRRSRRWNASCASSLDVRLAGGHSWASKGWGLTSLVTLF